jgi:acyl-CoA thioesterase-1
VNESRTAVVLLAALLAAAPGCSRPDVPRARDARRPAGLANPATGARVGAPSAAPADGQSGAPLEDSRPLVLFVGDSLTAGYGLAVDEAYPARVEELLAAAGTPIRAVNAGVSGDTTAGGLARIDRLLQQQPAIVVVEFGANDGLRGQPVDGIAANLREIVRRAQGAGARVVVAGMRIPPNYGAEYAEAFAAIYPAVAKETGATLLPFLLVEVAGRPELNQADGIHPTAEGQRRVARTVEGVLRPMLGAL